MTEAWKESSRVDLQSVLAFEAGEQTERAEIVGWLRGQADQPASFGETIACWLLALINPIGLARAALRSEADAIERLDHHKSEGQEG